MMMMTTKMSMSTHTLCSSTTFMNIARINMLKWGVMLMQLISLVIPLESSTASQQTLGWKWYVFFLSFVCGFQVIKPTHKTHLSIWTDSTQTSLEFTIYLLCLSYREFYVYSIYKSKCLCFYYMLTNIAV